MKLGEMAQLFDHIKSIYPKFMDNRKNGDEIRRSIKAWHSLCKNISYSDGIKIINKHASTSRYEPTISDVHTHFNSDPSMQPEYLKEGELYE